MRRGRASRAAGAFLAAVLRRVIFLPALRYVDDFFSADDGDGVGEAAAAAAELIRILLGGDAVQARKLEWGSPLVVLGVEVQAARAVSPPPLAALTARNAQATRWEFWAVPAPQKVELWSGIIREYLATDKMSPGARSSRCATRGSAARGR